MKGKNSIHTIAKELGVSATTVSLVLNGVGKENRLSNELIEKIQKHLRKIDYQPNVLAQALRTGRTNVIGMLVEDISDPFFSAIARGVEIGLEDSGYNIFFMITKNKLENSILRLDTLKGYNVDGYIIAPPPGSEKEIEKLISLSKPVVLYDRYFPSLDTCNVAVDNREGAYGGVMELINNNYKQVAFVTLLSNQMQMADRKSGYIAVISQIIQSTGLVLEVPYNLDMASASRMIKDFLVKNKNIDAVFFGTNYLAVSGIRALRELGLKIGQDIGVVGFDDDTNFAFFSPAVTVVAQPEIEISRTIVKNILSALSTNNICLSGTTLLPTKLIKRESSQKTAG